MARKSGLRAKRIRLIFDINPLLKKEFKAACSHRGQQMSDVVIKFVKAYVDNDRAIMERLAEKYGESKDGK